MDELLQSAASLGIDPEGKRHARHEPSVSEVPFNINNYLYVVLAGGEPVPPAAEASDIFGCGQRPGLADEGFHFPPRLQRTGPYAQRRRHRCREAPKTLFRHSPDFYADGCSARRVKEESGFRGCR